MRQQNKKVVYLNSTTLVITLSVNDLNPIQKQIVHLVFFKRPNHMLFKRNPL